MAHAKNFLNDLSIVYSEVIDGVKTLPDGTKQPYSDYTKKVVLALVDFVKRCPWSTNDTTKFVCRNYNIRQSNLDGLWATMHPDNPRTKVAFRVASSEINKHLTTIFPRDIITIFMSEDADKMGTIYELTQKYERAMLHVEGTITANMLDYLNKLPSTAKHFTVDECESELKLLAEWSKRSFNLDAMACDKDKMAFVYSTLIKPVMHRGKFNDTRMRFVIAYLDEIERINGRLATVAGDGTTAAKNSVKPTVSQGTGLSDSAVDLENTVVTDYIEGAEINEFDFPNPEIVKVLARLDRRYILNRLKSFSPSEVALTLQELSAKNPELLAVYDKELRSAKQGYMLGDYMFLSDVLEEVSDYIQGVSPSTDDVDPQAILLLLDYMSDTFYSRLHLIPKENMAKAIKELSDADSLGVQLVDKFRGVNLSELDEEKLTLVIEWLKAHKN